MAIILRLSEVEAENFCKLIEPIAAARPIYLNLLLSMRTCTESERRVLKLKRNSASQIIKLMRELDSQGTILGKVRAAIVASGGVLTGAETE